MKILSFYLNINFTVIFKVPFDLLPSFEKKKKLFVKT